MSIGVVDRKKLWTLARNQCAFPGCPAKLVEPLPNADGTHGAVEVLGEEAHIRSSRVGGPRHDPTYDSYLIDAYENLILLCPTHHTRVDKDNGRGYSIDQLIQMRRRHEQAGAKEDRLQRVYAAYLADQWIRDDKVLFEAVDLDGPSVDKMFVDVPIAAQAHTAAGRVLSAIRSAAPTDREAQEGADDLEVSGGAQALLSPLWRGNALIQGGPGQGKSTLLQFVCQFHRSRLVEEKDAQYTAAGAGLKEVTSVARLPIRIDLRRFAAWLADREREDRLKREKRTRKGKSAESPARNSRDPFVAYIARHISERSGLSFSISDFVTLLVERSVLIALDGLDEIASLNEREKCSKIIATSIPRLQANATDLSVIVATRPGATDSNQWADAAFSLMTLRPLTLGLKIQYLTKWCAQAGVSAERAADLHNKLVENQQVPHVRELGSNPMQLAILLHLLYRRGLLPQQRTELYREYVKTFLDREEKDKEPLLHSHRQVIVDVHAYLAWQLQTGAESDRYPSGSLTRMELIDHVRAYLAGSTESLAFADQLIAALTSRVLCLVERQPGYFEFEVQSLREYFAAVYVYEEAPPNGVSNSRDDCLSTLIERPYWSNVMRFLVGMLSKGEVKSLIVNLRSRAAEPDSNLDPYLRWVATQLLDDRIYENQADLQRQEVVEFILGGSGIVLGEDGLLDASGLPLILAENAGARQLVTHVKARLLSETDANVRGALVASLRRHLDKSEIRTWAWGVVDGHRPLRSTELDFLADISALSDLNRAQTSRLVEAIPVWKRESDDPILAVLARGDYDGTEPEIVEAALADVLDGAGDLLSKRRVEGLTGELGTILRLGQAEPRRTQGRSRRNDTADQSSTRRRKRTRGGQPLARTTEERIAAWAAADLTAGSTGGEAAWFELIESVRDVRPDSWVLRTLLTAVDDDVDLSLGYSAALEASAGWRAQAAWVREAKARSTDVDWWTAQAVPTERLARRHWLLIVLGIAGTQPLIACMPRVQAAVEELADLEFETLHATLFRFSKRPNARTVNLRDRFRRGWSLQPRTALLLTNRCGDLESAAFLYRAIVEASLPSGLMGAVSVSVVRDAVNAVRAPGGFKYFEDARSLFPLNSLRHLAVGRPMPLPQAREILQDPQRWPSDVVGLAARRLRAKRSSGLPTISEVERRDRWFDTSGAS